MNQPAQPVPTERAQIVIAYNTPQAPIIMRYNKTAKGVLVFAKLRKAWFAYCKRSDGSHELFDLDADMFSSVIDLSQIATISFVEHAVRNKFIPQ